MHAELGCFICLELLGKQDVPMHVHGLFTKSAINILHIISIVYGLVSAKTKSIEHPCLSFHDVFLHSINVIRQSRTADGALTESIAEGRKPIFIHMQLLKKQKIQNHLFMHGFLQISNWLLLYVHTMSETNPVAG